jgi:hypothetical protein
LNEGVFNVEEVRHDINWCDEPECGERAEDVVVDFRGRGVQ